MCNRVQLREIGAATVLAHGEALRRGESYFVPMLADLEGLPEQVQDDLRRYAARMRLELYEWDYAQRYRKHVSGERLVSDVRPTAYESAKQIVENSTDWSYGDGQRIIETLLAGRQSDDLTLEELRLASKGFNWWGKHGLSLEAARRALVLEPTSVELHGEAAIAIRNSVCSGEAPFTSLLAMFDWCIRENLGSPAFWHFQKAGEYYDLATQNPEWQDYMDWRKGDPIYQPAALTEACRELAIAVQLDPRIREDKQWQEDFLALHDTPEYQRIIQP